MHLKMSMTYLCTGCPLNAIDLSSLITQGKYDYTFSFNPILIQYVSINEEHSTKRMPTYVNRAVYVCIEMYVNGSVCRLLPYCVSRVPNQCHHVVKRTT